MDPFDMTAHSHTHPALVIAGMHRSGTSLATSILGSSGLAIGDRLLAGGVGNPDGHFEDLDFVSLHERMLQANGLGSEGYVAVERITVSPTLEAEARAIIDRRRKAGKAWGWKDPRTTLFLDFWASLLSEARFLLLVRRPWEVVDSLYRRGDESFILNPAFAIDVWVAYNRRIRDFFLEHRDRCLLVDSGRVVGDCPGLVAAVRDTLGIPLGEPEALAKPHLFRKDDHSRRRDLLGAVSPEAIGLHEELLSLAWRADERLVAPIDTTIAPRLAMEEWGRAARAEAAAADRAARLATVHASHGRLEAELASIRMELDCTRTERDHLRCTLESAVVDQSPKPLPMPPKKNLSHRIARESRRLYRQARAAVDRLGPRRSQPTSGDRPDSAEAA